MMKKQNNKMRYDTIKMKCVIKNNTWNKISKSYQNKTT